MKNYNTIEYIGFGKLAVLKLNRPEKRNALNQEMINELTDFFNSFKTKENVVLLQIIGNGESFCAGADIEWLRNFENSPKDIIREGFLSLANMFSAMYGLPQIVMSMAHGAVYGGGIGLLACSDFVISSPGTVYSFSEIDLGLIPSVISLYVLEKIGERNAGKLFFTGEKFDENKAIEIGLVDQVPNPDPGGLNDETLMETLLKKPHHALKSMKKLMRGSKNTQAYSKLQEKNSQLIADLIASQETQELFKKFLQRK